MHIRPTLNAKTSFFFIVQLLDLYISVPVKRTYLAPKILQRQILVYCDLMYFFISCLCPLLRFSHFYLWFNNMALEQLPDVTLQLRPDFTRRSINCAYKGAQKLGFLFLPRIPRNIDPKILQTRFLLALLSLASKTFAWLMSGTASCCKYQNRTADFQNENCTFLCG